MQTTGQERGKDALTKMQIENATTQELKRLQDRIEAELQGREAQERDHESSTVEVLERHKTPAGTFLQERQEARPVAVSVLLPRFRQAP
jgi:hypothetical protein